MKLYKIAITPTSNFLTTLKGDTLFGHLCWAIAYKYGEEKLTSLLDDYDKKPFMVVSDAFAAGYVPKPTLPSFLLNEDSDLKKQNRKKIWLTLEDLQKGNFLNAQKEQFDKSGTSVKNSINYLSGTTGKSLYSFLTFDPYTLEEKVYGKKDIYVLIRKDISEQFVKELFEYLGNIGYGKKTTIGKGRFLVDSIGFVDIQKNSSAFLCLSPFTPQALDCEDIYYEPFVRFGKSGGSRAIKNPFKKPLLMANRGAVLFFEKQKKLQYVGNAIENISTYTDIVHQGYSIVLPIKDVR